MNVSSVQVCQELVESSAWLIAQLSSAWRRPSLAVVLIKELLARKDAYELIYWVYHSDYSWQMKFVIKLVRERTAPLAMQVTTLLADRVSVKMSKAQQAKSDKKSQLLDEQERRLLLKLDLLMKEFRKFFEDEEDENTFFERVCERIEDFDPSDCGKGCDGLNGKILNKLAEVGELGRSVMLYDLSTTALDKLIQQLNGEIANRKSHTERIVEKLEWRDLEELLKL